MSAWVPTLLVPGVTTATNEENIMDMQLISNEMIVNEYGDRHDGIYVYKGTKKIGLMTDLRKKLASNKKLKAKQKEYRDKKSEERKEALHESVPEMVDFLKNHLVKYDAEVFINQTQPNVHINGCVCYVVVEPLTLQHRLGIKHPVLTQDDMADEVGNQFRISASDSTNHILLNGLSQDDIVEVIIKLCK
ncbi:hypothetical protein [Escherichia phage pEC-M719-6WT.2]|nr:hypothetical protein [Escherichia phage pEC-M719-6WT.2]